MDGWMVSDLGEDFKQLVTPHDSQSVVGLRLRFRFQDLWPNLLGRPTVSVSLTLGRALRSALRRRF